MEVPVIYYHSIAPSVNRSWSKNYLTLELKYFNDQMHYLKKEKFRTIFLDEYFTLRNIEVSKEKIICITFDDGFLDNWIYVFPILKKLSFKSTIFVSPEFVDLKNGIRHNLDDYWNNKHSFEQINKWGYLSWEEMNEMNVSGLVDIQSHALKHTKYFVSDRITGFHKPGSDSITYIGNKYPLWKPYYIGSQDFERLLPYGYPVFEEASSLISRKLEINPDFMEEAVTLLNKKFKSVTDKSYPELFSIVEPLLIAYKRNSGLITHSESEHEFLSRVSFELTESKKTIENKLNKKVEYLCFPGGEYNVQSVGEAVKAGYKGISLNKDSDSQIIKNGIKRTGLYKVKNNRFLSLLKVKYKIRSIRKEFPYYQIKRIYNRFSHYQI